MGALKLPEELPYYSYDDYSQWQGQWEIIDGIPYAMSPMPKGRHQRISNNLAFEFQKNLKECKRCKAYMPVDWEVDKHTILQPDNLVVCDLEDDDFIKLTKPPVLVVEILSPSTALKDKNIKYRIYEEAGVKYYIIVDPDTLSATVYELKEGRYVELGSFTSKDSCRLYIEHSEGCCELSVDFEEVFDI
ncbi:MAG: Uma2 family endonuclease [Campylobacterales bacterium]